MKRTKKVLMFVLALASVACTSLALASCGTPVEPPVAVAKVYSVTLQHDSTNVNGVLSVDLSVGTVQLSAVVIKDEGAPATVVYTSSDPSVAEVDENGLITLNATGETVITATVGDLKHEIVLTVSNTMSVSGYAITVNGGVADLTEAQAGEMVVLTPVIPEDKEFSHWTWDEKILQMSGNIFTMPDSAVTITANFVDKLASLSVASAPDNNAMAKGAKLNTDGLQIFAHAAISGEEWNVTKQCTFSEYTGGNTVTASYTLGEVTKTVDIEVKEVTSYTVDPLTVQATAENQRQMNAMPKVMDASYDKYKTTGFIAGNGDKIRFSYENATFCVSNIVGGQDVTYYIWSDVAANARITASVASCAYFNAAGTSGTPDSVKEAVLANNLTCYLNSDTTTPLTINPAAKAEAHQLETPSWSVCGIFNEAYLFDITLEYGWNSLTFLPGGSQINLASVKAEFTGKELTAFVPNLEMGLKQDMQLSAEPTDLDKDLDGYKETGAVWLDHREFANYAIGNEGGTMAIKGMQKGYKATYYFYSEGAGTATVKLKAASASYYDFIDGAPSAVYEIDFRSHYSIKVNGSVTAAMESAKIPAYSQDAGSWSVCQRFVTFDLLTMDVKKGWNAIEFESLDSKVANMANLTIEWNY